MEWREDLAGEASVLIKRYERGELGDLTRDQVLARINPKHVEYATLRLREIDAQRAVEKQHLERPTQ